MEDSVKCPKCGFEQSEGPECLKCGVVFAKLDPVRNLPLSNSSREVPPDPGEYQKIVDETDRWLGKTGKYIIIVLMAFFFFYMVIKRSSWCFLDYINLPFHETGHFMFMFFGETMSFLGGTIGQLMWPFILIIYFMRRKEYLSASFCLFWFGENFLNISKYVADSRLMALPLVGGGIHDWNTLLGKWHILHYDRAIARVVFFLGVIIMISSMVWAFVAKPKRDDGIPA